MKFIVIKNNLKEGLSVVEKINRINNHKQKTEKKHTNKPFNFLV